VLGRLSAGALRPQESAVLVRPLRLSTFGARRAASRRQPRALARASSPPPRSCQARCHGKGPFSRAHRS
jgi:hypothetical protein